MAEKTDLWIISEIEIFFFFVFKAIENGLYSTTGELKLAVVSVCMGNICYRVWIIKDCQCILDFFSNRLFPSSGLSDPEWRLFRSYTNSATLWNLRQLSEKN